MADYPRGPHDQPQSMCPAFGSLRVGLRMRRTATILSGSACCVYGLTFTSHFYGARRSVGYVPFNSEIAGQGQLFEDIRDAVYETAKPADYDAVVVINLCVPTASGVPLDLLPKQIDGVRIIGIDVPGFGVPTHAEAKDVLTGAMLKYARTEAERGPVARPRTLADRPTVAMLGELFPADPPGVGALLAPMGLAMAPSLPCREWRDLYAALDCQRGCRRPSVLHRLRARIARGRAAGGGLGAGGRGRHRGVARCSGRCSGRERSQIDAAKDAALPAIRAALAANPIKARITVSGYEGSELLVARLLMEAGADMPYVGTACPRTEWSEADRDWLEARGTHVQYRASLEQDLCAMQDVRPDLAIGTTPLVQKAKELGIPALYFTNMVSARPLMGAAGARALAAIVAAQTRGAPRFARMVSFFEGVGTGEPPAMAGAASRSSRKARASAPARTAGRQVARSGGHLGDAGARS